MREKILASDGHSALLRSGEVACIGFLHKCERLAANGVATVCQVIELDLHQNGRKDYFFFNDGVLSNCGICSGGDRYMLKIYKQLVAAKECTLNNFLVVVTASFCAYMLNGADS